jgi:hypothetical protein
VFYRGKKLEYTGTWAEDDKTDLRLVSILSFMTLGPEVFMAAVIGTVKPLK